MNESHQERPESPVSAEIRQLSSTANELTAIIDQLRGMLLPALRPADPPPPACETKPGCNDISTCDLVTEIAACRGRIERGIESLQDTTDRLEI